MAFTPGKSGNPGGRPAETAMGREIKLLAKASCPEALKKLVQWMRSDNPTASIAACNAILDRALGKPMQALEIDTTIRHAVELSDADLADIAAGGRPGAAKAPRGPSEPPPVH